MANETTSTALTEIVNSEAISRLILAYGADASVVAPLCAVLDISGQATAAGSFPQWELDATEDITEGSTTLSNVQLQTTEIAAITAGQIGVLREVTEYAAATNLLGEEGLRRFIVEDGAKLCTLDLENDLCALFSGFATTVGTSGSDLTVANFVEAISRVEGLKNARGRKAAVLDDQQAFDLRAAVAASTGTVFASAAQQLQDVLMQREDNGYVGNLFGVEIFQTNLTDTANTNADVVGWMGIDARSNPSYASLGIVQLWLPRVRMLMLPDQVAEQVATTAAWGVGRISDFAVDITTDL